MAIPNHRRRNDKKIDRVTLSVYFNGKDYELIEQAILLSNSPNRVAFIEEAVMEKCDKVIKKMQKKAAIMAQQRKTK